MVVKKAGNLFLQTLSDTLAFGLQNQLFRCILATHKPEQAVLQAVERVLQREIENLPLIHLAHKSEILLESCQ